MADGNQNRQSFTFYFECGEYITEFSLFAGDIIDSIKIITNKGRKFAVGGFNSGGPYTLPIPAGHRVLTFNGNLRRDTGDQRYYLGSIGFNTALVPTDQQYSCYFNKYNQNRNC